MVFLRMNIYLILVWSILNIFKVLKISGFVNYLLLNKYGYVFLYEMNGLKFYLLKINWKWIGEIDLKIVYS